MRDRGAALLVAVMASLVVSAIALGVQRESRTLVLVARNETRAAEAMAAAEAGIARLALVVAAAAEGVPVPPEPAERTRDAGLRTLGAEGLPVPNGRAYGLSFGAAELTLRVVAEDAKIDLNTADPALVATLARQLRLTGGDRLAARIARTRLRDGSQGIAWRLGERFQSVDEAGSEDIPRASFEALRPYLTVASGRPAPDPSLVDDVLFAALPLDPEARAVLIAERAAPGRAFWARDDARALTLAAEATLPDGTTARAEALVRIIPGETPPLRVLRTAGAPAARLPATD